MSMDEVPLLSRAAGGQFVEFRHDAPLWIAQVLQGVAQARGVSRATVVNEVLGEYCKARLRESTFVQRTTRGNPEVADLIGQGLES